MINKIALVVMVSLFLGTGATQLKVTVKNVKVGKGDVFVAVYNSQELFLKKAFAEKSLAPATPQLEFDFDIPMGEYAVFVYQDVNGNKKLDLGLFNIPREPTGFSNNFRPRFSKPEFTDAAVKLMQPAVTCMIELK